MNYGHWTGDNLLSNYADGIISPDILSIVHKAMINSIYSKPFLLKLHILRFLKEVQFPGTERIVLYYAAAPKAGTHTWFPE